MTLHISEPRPPTTEKLRTLTMPTSNHGRNSWLFILTDPFTLLLLILRIGNHFTDAVAEDYLLTTSLSTATEFRLLPVQESCVRGGKHTDTNFGTVQRSSVAIVGNPRMNCKYTETMQRDNYRESYIQFDLSSLTNSIDDQNNNGALLKAGLVMHVRTNNKASQNPLLNVSYVEENSWQETTLTLNTRPSSSGEWVTMDLTEVVNKVWRQNDKVVSLLLQGGDTTSKATLGFATRDDTHDRQPYLLIARDDGGASSATPTVAPVATAMPVATL